MIEVLLKRFPQWEKNARVMCLSEATLGASAPQVSADPPIANMVEDLVPGGTRAVAGGFSGSDGHANKILLVEMPGWYRSCTDPSDIPYLRDISRASHSG